MFKTNVGGIDRVLRIVVGIVLIALVFLGLMLIAPLIMLALLNAWFDYRSADNVALQQDQRLLALLPLESELEAETLKAWRVNFDRAIAEGRLPPGFDARFQRLWRFYLMYCEGGFRGGGITVAQVTLIKR